MSDQERAPSPEPASQSVPSESYVNDPVRNDTEDVAGKIFIGGLSWQTTELNLRYYFEKFGELTDVALMMDKRTGKPRCATLAVFPVQCVNRSLHNSAAAAAAASLLLTYVRVPFRLCSQRLWIHQDEGPRR